MELKDWRKIHGLCNKTTGDYIYLTINPPLVMPMDYVPFTYDELDAWSYALRMARRWTRGEQRGFFNTWWLEFFPEKMNQPNTILDDIPDSWVK